MITIPKLKKPTLKEIQKEWGWIQSIESDRSETKKTTLNLSSVLRTGESYISGGEYEKRLPQSGLLGFQQAQWLVKHQDKFPDFMDLQNIYIDFPGLVVVDADGNRRVPFLDQRGGRWYLRWYWLGDDFYSDGRIAFSSKVAPDTSDNSDLSTQSLRLSALEQKMEKIEKILRL